MSNAAVDRLLERRRCARRWRNVVARRERFAAMRPVAREVVVPAVVARPGFWARVWAWVRRLFGA